MLTKRALGKMGEDIATRYLLSRGFHVKRRNFRLKIGEIDIIAEKDGIMHFVEVKSVAREMSVVQNQGKQTLSVSTGYSPFDNIHSKKMRRVARAVAIYIGKFHVKAWQSDVVTVVFDPEKKIAECNLIENVLLSL